MLGHEHTGAALLTGAFAAKTADLVVLVDLVELEHSKLDVFVPGRSEYSGKRKEKEKKNRQEQVGR